MRARLTLAFLATVALIGIIVLLSYRSTERLVAAGESERLASARTHTLQRISATVAEARSAQRAFLLTGQDQVLEPYHAAVERLPEERIRLDSLGLTGPAVNRMNGLLDRSLDDLDRGITTFRLDGPEAAEAGVAAGEARMDSLETALEGLGAAERRMLARVRPEEDEQARDILMGTLALAGAGLLVLAGFFLALLRQYERHQRTLAELGRVRAQLEERVRERTAMLELELAQRRQAEQERVASETQYRRLVEQVKDHAIFSMAPDGSAISWNEGVGRVLGFAESEFIGSPVETIFVPEDVRAGIPWKELDEAARDGVANDDRWMRRKDGSWFFANGSTSAVRDEAGALVGFSKVMRDRTEWKQTAEALLDSETRYRLVALASRETIWDWDLARDSVSWNEGLESQFGYPAMGESRDTGWWEERVHPDDRETVRRGRREAIERGDTYWTAEYRFRRSDGEYAMVADRGIIARDPQGRATRMLGTIADLTERRRTDEKLAQAQRMEAVGRLAGGIAHDLNNMLTAIVGYSTFLEQSLPADDSRQADIAEITRAADRSTALTRSLLAFARRDIVQPQPLDLNRVVMEMGRMLRPAMGENIAVELNLEPIEGTVVADRGRVEQVILNIALNARDAMSSGGRLSIATRSVTLGGEDLARHPGTEIPPGPYVKLTISDTGHGMDRQTLARVFEPFFTTKQVGEGTGLGLSTVYGTVKQAGGFIWAYSEPGHGSAFNVYLPESPAAAVRELDEEKPAASRRGGSETILVVEDEPIVRQLAERVLAAEGYHVLSASSGEDAVELLADAARPVDLVITDIVMPGMGGRELAGLARERFPRALVLFSSGFTDDEVVRRGLMDSGEPFLEKPWSGDDLLARVRDLLDRHADRTGWSRVSREGLVAG